MWCSRTGECVLMLYPCSEQYFWHSLKLLFYCPSFTITFAYLVRVISLWVETPHRHHTWHILTTHRIVNLVLMVAEAGEAPAASCWWWWGSMRVTVIWWTFIMFQNSFSHKRIPRQVVVTSDNKLRNVGILVVDMLEQNILDHLVFTNYLMYKLKSVFVWFSKSLKEYVLSWTIIMV